MEHIADFILWFLLADESNITFGGRVSGSRHWRHSHLDIARGNKCTISLADASQRLGRISHFIFGTIRHMADDHNFLVLLER
jgi:hypothetical protein